MGNHAPGRAVKVLPTCGTPSIEGFGDTVKREATLTVVSSEVTVELL
jgi:hypothetical protein